MHAATGFLALATFALAAAAAQAASQRGTLRISMTVVERCDIHDGPGSPSVDCSAGAPWTVAPLRAAATAARTDRAPLASYLPVPQDLPPDADPVTTIVF